MAGNGGRFYYVPKRLTRYRIHPFMETARRSPDKFENMIYVYQRLIDLKKFPKLERHLTCCLSGAYFRVGRDRLLFNMTGESRESFVEALRIDLNWRPAAAYCLS